MDKFEENQAGSKQIKRKADPESKCNFLRSAKTKQIKDTAFQLSRKTEIAKGTSDIAQDSTSLQETKNSENSEKNAENEKCKKMKSVKNLNNSNSDLNEFKLFVKEDCQFKSDISSEDHTLMKKKSNRTEIKHKRAKIGDSFKEDFKEASSKECNETVESPQEIKTHSRDTIEKVVTVDVKETAEKTDKNEILSKEKVNELRDTDTEYIPFSNYFDITIPVMGKIIFQNGDEKPFTKRYDLAVERNKKRFRYMKKTGCDDGILRLIESEANFSENDKKKKAMEKKNKDIRMACYITELCKKILKELTRDNIREEKIICHLEKFFFSRVTPTCLLYVPQLVHTISFIRGHKTFSKVLRLIANECYDKCHAMFPIPAGYNFETVYTSEVRKFLPNDFDKMEDIPFDYGDIDDLLESSDSDD